jgi:pSer/pThr/pTyr-binding forkhead associated (FHA) protein
VAGLETTASRTGAWLTLRGADGITTEFRLPDVTRIGRHPINTLKLTDREISKEHAEITRVSGEWWVQDLKSSNGTLVNGKRITRVKLRDGDEIAMGASSLVFHCPSAPASLPHGGNVTMVQSVAPHVLASVRAAPVDVQVAVRGQVQAREVGVRISQHIAAGPQRCPAEVDYAIDRHRVAPAEIIEPGLHADVAEDRPAGPQADGPGAGAVIHNLVIIEREERWDHAVPVHHGRSALHVELVVLPDADDVRSLADDRRFAA